MLLIPKSIPVTFLTGNFKDINSLILNCIGKGKAIRRTKKIIKIKNKVGKIILLIFLTHTIKLP